MTTKVPSLRQFPMIPMPRLARALDTTEHGVRQIVARLNIQPHTNHARSHRHLTFAECETIAAEFARTK